MRLKIMGDPPLMRDAQGKLKSRISTLFPRTAELITRPGIHAGQRMMYLDLLNEQRRAAGLPPLSPEEELEECEHSVDLIHEPDLILIRPDPANMHLAFEADALLQELVSKRQIKFLQVSDMQVRQAIKESGECWRISPLPRSVEEMKKMILESRISIGGNPIYYYNKLTGTRYLTCHEFAQLRGLKPQALASHLQEIADYSRKTNRMNYPEVDFFLADASFGAADFAALDWTQASPEALVVAHQILTAKFQYAVPADLRDDNPNHPEWRNRMFSHLIGQKNEVLSEEVLQGLSPEFFLQIEWLPGGRIEDGELLFDSIFYEPGAGASAPELNILCDDKIKGFIFNFIREFGDVEYVNVGRLVSSLSQRPEKDGRREVYIAELKQPGSAAPVVRIIRMQKWGIREHLDENKDLLSAIMEAEEYTDYILDRRLGCRQLGMNLPSRIALWRISEKYNGGNRPYRGAAIWATYFERDYISGVATDKIARAKYESAPFTLAFARLLGKAAAPNMIVGRCNSKKEVLFDDGDEVLLEDAAGLPQQIVVADSTGAFVDFQAPLDAFAQAYAKPVCRRLADVPQPRDFAMAYVEAFVKSFIHIQGDYRKRQRAFDTLFKHCKRDEQGSFAYRWEQILARLDRTDATTLGNQIKAHIAL